MTKVWTPEMAKLHSMWTPEMFDRFEADLRALLQNSTEYKDKPAEREEIIAGLKKRAIELTDTKAT